MEERRAQPRSKVMIDIILKRNPQQVEAIAYTLAATGLSVICSADFPKGETFTVIIPEAHGPERFAGTIAWKKTDDRDHVFQYGLEFKTPLDVNQQKLFMHYNKLTF